ncbi:hypothetical protein L3X38_042776 [Prunus dulcis]|uniref:Retrotransposon gag domain-containing protein n=1 Tax=Prunus dulcis TaxID=3755 RepID=A0AAD4YLL6_PRUDU|nr:hypothetical protein L3X38_042776 [Prunus dulcis]
MEVPEHKMVKMVAFHLKATAAVWWDQLQNSRQRQGKQRILYRMYLGCAQGNRSVSEYTEEFMRLAERNHLTETLQEVFNMAMKAELLEKEKRQPNFRRNTTEASEYATGASSGSRDKRKCSSNLEERRNQRQLSKTKTLTKAAAGLSIEGSPETNPRIQRKQANFIEEVDEDEEKDEVGEDDYARAEFAIEEGMERTTLVLQRVLLAPKEEGQRHSIFRSLCSIKNKVCDVIVDNGSCENFVSKKLVEHLQLSTEPHVSPYSLGWVKKGPSVRVAETCGVPLSIGKHYSDDVLCDVIDIDACHILLGRPGQFDVDATYKGRDNVILFSWNNQKIAMATTKPSKTIC